MRVRENRTNVWRSLSTTVRLDGRAQLVRHIAGKLGKNGAAITDEIIHVTHYGYDDRIDWDEYIIVVEGFGVFGYSDEPCPAQAAAPALMQIEVEISPPAPRRRIASSNARLPRVAEPAAKRKPISQGWSGR